jgi:hypothetical protein
VLHLGANVPLEELVSSIAAGKIRLVVSVAQHLRTAATLMKMAQAVQAQGVPLAYGGRVFNLNPALAERIPGYFIGESLDEAPRIIEQLLGSPPSLPVKELPEVGGDVQRRFRAHLPIVETDVEERMRGSGMPPSDVLSANEDLARVIQGALALGDPGLIPDEIEWLRGRLGYQGVASQVIQRYLDTYFEVLRTRLGSDADPILAHIASLP